MDLFKISFLRFFTCHAVKKDTSNKMISAWIYFAKTSLDTDGTLDSNLKLRGGPE